jgi:uncharacterized protein YhaN
MMRLRQLNLDVFGHFSGHQYDFGDRSECDFHILYGPNEAGKTTTMEGYLRLLYGFPLRERYAFQHQRKNLQVSGLLEIDGDARQITRLPSSNGALVDAHGNPLPEATFSRHLGGMSERDYRALLCLDDHTIEQGGEEIASSKGDIGHLLFSAAAGVADLSQVLDAVRSKADEFYKKRSSKTQMAALKKELGDLKKEIDALDVPATAYKKLKQDRDTATASEQEARKARQVIAARLAQATAQAEALPMLAQLDRLNADLGPIAHYPSDLPVEPEALLERMSAYERASATAERLGKEITALEARLAELKRSPEDLSLADTLEALDMKRTRFRGAEADLERRQTTLSHVLQDMKGLAADLAASTLPIEKLVLPDGQLGRLEVALDHLGKAQALATERKAALSEQAMRFTEAQAALDAVPPLDPQQSAVQDIFERTEVETLGPTYARATEAIRQAEFAADTAMDALTHLGQSFDALPALPITSTDAEHLAERHADLIRQHDDLEATREGLETDRRQRLQEAEALRKSSGLMGDEAAQSLLNARNSAWDAHRAALSGESADSFWSTQQTLDQASAKRLQQARDLARLREAEAAVDALTICLETAQRTAEKCQGQLREITAQIAGHCERAGLAAPMGPRAFAGWISKLEAAHNASRHLRRVREQHADILTKAKVIAADLRAAMEIADNNFETVITKARAVAVEATRSKAAREKAAQAAMIAKQTHQQAKLRLSDAEEAAHGSQERWNALITDIAGGALSAETLMHSLKPLRDLRVHDSKRKDLSRQIDAMTADKSAFLDAMLALAKQYDLPETSPLEIFAGLQQRLAQAEKTEENYAAMTQTLAHAREGLATAQKTLVRLNEETQAEARLFNLQEPPNDLTSLRQAALACQQAIALRRAIAELEAGILKRLGCADIAAARQDLASATLPELEALAGTLQHDLNAAEERWQVALSARTLAENALSSVSADGDVAALTARRAVIELEIEDCARRYLKLHIGHKLAEEALRRYRDTHRSGMLQATETAFAALTDGAYSQLRTQVDGGTEVLLAIDASGRAKRTEDMSKGTRFQLYLALRAAAYEQLAAQGTCLPFFCDDIFETFDEARTRAACRLMQRIGKTGQAIYLTHHRHVLDIAQQACGDAVRIHYIQGAPDTA